MTIEVYDFPHYREFVSAWIRARPAGGHGERSKIATALRCHVAYVSQVLKGHADFSQEQGQDLADYVGLDEDAADYLQLLIGRARAGTARLRESCDRKLEKALASRRVLKNRFSKATTLSAADQTVYFSAWYYGAIHVIVMMIPRIDSVEKIGEYLRLPKATVKKALQFLETKGLIASGPAGYLRGPLSIHLGTDSPMLSRHHANWRVAALSALDHERAHNLHYSSAVAIRRSDAEKIRKILVQAIETARGAIEKSTKEDALYAFSLDFFEVGG